MCTNKNMLKIAKTNVSKESTYSSKLQLYT